jgi:hypothetical protein
VLSELFFNRFVEDKESCYYKVKASIILILDTFFSEKYEKVFNNTNKDLKMLINEADYIDFEFFCNSLCITALILETSNIDIDTEEEKILFLLEKMSQSKGVSSSQRLNGNTLFISN